MSEDKAPQYKIDYSQKDKIVLIYSRQDEYGLLQGLKTLKLYKSVGYKLLRIENDYQNDSINIYLETLCQRQ